MAAFSLRTATIANGASLSDAVTFPSGCTVVAIIMPSAWTAATLTFAATYDLITTSTFLPVYATDGTEMTATVSTSRHVAVSPADLMGVQQLKVRSGAVGAAVAQGGARTIKLVLRTVV